MASRKPFALAALLLGVSFAAALAWGATAGWDSEIVLSLRLPRALLAAGVGAGLAVAGTALQALFTNPLCEPYTLGISSGAALGSVVGAAFGLGGAIAGLALPALGGALVFALALNAVAARGARRGRGVSGAGLLLAGVMLQFLGASLVSLWMSLTDAQGAQAALSWLLGDLSRARLSGALFTLAGVALFALAIWRRSRELDALLLGEDDAASLGVDVRRVRRRLIFATSFLVALCVSASGMVGFVGLVVPHFARRAVGPLHRRLLIMSALGGASALLIADLLARKLASPYELPAGVVTGLLGAPLFLWILVRRPAEVARG
jgi:iron complex transport system permease protein